VPEIAIPSYGSVFVRLTRFDSESAEDKEQGSGTAFIASNGPGSFLVTNWHVLTGSNPETGEQRGYIPDTIWVDFHSDDVEIPSTHRYPLYDAQRTPLWLVHPERGHAVDIAALPFALGGSWGIHPGRAVRIESYRLDGSPHEILIEPTTDVSVIGYPFGQRSAGTLGIWTRGTVATEPELPYQGDPVFLIDCRAREGQSGSPVIAYRPSHTMTRLTNGHTVAFSGPTWNLLGVYAGRINPQSDLGRVWKRHLIREVVESGVRDSFDFY
jgi:hypothetical protein